MKRLILFELIILFLATTFESDSPPGWFQQMLPVNETVRDIFFLDSLTGWVVSSNQTFPANDTGYIMRTTNGGTNWVVQLDSMFNYYAVQFIDLSIGYAAGGTGRAKFLKTTNGGGSWSVTTPFGSNMYAILDLAFINKDTGWVCGDDSFGGGVFKTTNGGGSWVLQLNNTYRPVKLFFINKDTGWVGTSDANGRLFRTTNGGANWNLQFTSIAPIGAIYFLNSLKGWIRGGTSGTNGVAYTTNSGVNWINGQGEIGGYDIKFINDSIGFAGGGSQPLRIIKSRDGGKTWGYQTAQITADVSVSVLRNDTLNAWAGRQLLLHTTDGGGPIIYTGIGINPNSGVVPSFNLKQNYPNPFNPSTNITFEVTRNSKISLKIFNMLGEEVDEIIDFEKHNTGTYTVSYETDDDMPSGVYFYQITAWTEDKKEIFIDSKKMILLK